MKMNKRRYQREVLPLQLRVMQAVVCHRRRQAVEHLDRGLKSSGLLLESLGHVEHQAEGDDGGQQDVENTLVDVDRPDLEPGVQFELVSRRESTA